MHTVKSNTRTRADPRYINYVFTPYYRGVAIMVRKSLAQKILEELEGLYDEDGSFLLIYWVALKGGRICTHFYDNVKRLLNSLEDGYQLRNGVIKCRRFKTAQALRMLADHYKLENRIFKVSPI